MEADLTALNRRRRHHLKRLRLMAADQRTRQPGVLPSTNGVGVPAAPSLPPVSPAGDPRRYTSARNAAPDGGQLAPYLGLDDLLIKPGLLQCSRVEKLQRRPGALNRSPRKLAFVEQMREHALDQVDRVTCGSTSRTPQRCGCSGARCVPKSCAARDLPACAGVDVSWTPLRCPTLYPNVTVANPAALAA